MEIYKPFILGLMETEKCAELVKSTKTILICTIKVLTKQKSPTSIDKQFVSTSVHQLKMTKSNA